MAAEDYLIVPNIKNVGIFDSRVTYPKYFVTDVRNVRYYEIEYFTEDGGFSFIDGIKYPIQKGCILCSKPGQKRNSILHFKCYYLYLEIDKGQLFEILNNLPDMMPVFDTNKFLSMFDSIRQGYCSDSDGSEIYIKGKLLEFIDFIKNNASLHEKQQLLPVTVESRQILKGIEYINDNYHKPITLSEIAAAVNLSPIYFHKLFKLFMNKTPHHYLTEKRLSTAKELLLTSELSMTEIAFRCGFSSQSYFNSFFKSMLGQTPRHYKHQLYSKDFL